MPDAAKLGEEAEGDSVCVCAGAVPCTAEEESFNACFERLLCLWIPKGICLMNNIVAVAHDRVPSTSMGFGASILCTASAADCCFGGAATEMRAATESRLRRLNF